MRIAVLRGGPSNQYELSLDSGATAIKYLRKYHDVEDIFIDRDGLWHRGGVVVTPEEALRHIDFVVNALHGQYGEDGKVQALLDTLGVPYTGARTFAASTTMNKVLTKQFLKDHGIRMAGHVVIENDIDLDDKLHAAFPDIDDYLVVKVIDGGDSLGVVAVDNFDDLKRAVLMNLELGHSVLIEEFVKGRELKCGVVEGFRGSDHYPLLPIEIEKTDGDVIYYPYKDTYRYHVPARLTTDEKKEVMELARLIHEKLGLAHYSLSDFILTDNGLVLLEVNTLPLLGEQWHFAHSLRGTGAGLEEFFRHLVSIK